MKHRHHSNEHEKEKIEKKQVKEFLVKAGIQFTLLESKKKDPPDLIMVTPEQKSIGIEHTRIFNQGGELTRGKYAAFDRVIENAQSEYASLGLPALRVDFDFAGDIDTSGEKGLALSSALCDLIRVELKRPENKGLQYFDISDEALPDYVKSIEVFRQNEGKLNNWNRPIKSWSNAITIEELVKPIQGKNNRLIDLAWNKDYHEAWLVLIVEGEQWSEFATYRPKGFIVNPDWKFDKIFIYGMFAGNWETIK